MKYTQEEVQAELPYLLDKYGDEYCTDRGTEYLDGYDLTYRFFGADRDDGFAEDSVTVRYYY